MSCSPRLESTLFSPDQTLYERSGKMESCAVWIKHWFCFDAKHCGGEFVCLCLGFLCDWDKALLKEDWILWVGLIKVKVFLMFRLRQNFRLLLIQTFSFVCSWKSHSIVVGIARRFLKPISGLDFRGFEGRLSCFSCILRDHYLRSSLFEAAYQVALRA